MKNLLKFKWKIVFILLISLAFFARFYKVTESPPAPYWEEVALGYDAYSILETGKDHHGNPWPIIAFESFGDWKPSGYFYALVPFIKLLGLNTLAVRMPSVLAGVMIVIGVGVLADLLGRELGLKKKRLELFVFFSSLVAAVSPWLIQFSRGGWEVNLATALVTWGAVFGFKSLSKKEKNKHLFINLTSVFFILSMYVYHSARVLAPVLGLSIGLIFLKKDWDKNKNSLKKFPWAKYLFHAFLVFCLLFPFFKAWGSPELGQRIAETSIFSDISVIEQSNVLKEQFNNVWWSRLIYHRHLLFTGKIIEQGLTHFSLDFLFVGGDANPRHGSQYFGLFYPFEIIFLIWGVFSLIGKKNKQPFLLLSTWLVFGILPAALTKTVPHALRILLTAPVFMLMVGLGLMEFKFYIDSLLRKLKLGVFKSLGSLTVPALVVIYLLSFCLLFNHLINIYPEKYGDSWMVGYEEKIMMIEKEKQENPDKIIEISRSMGRPAMYYWFYTQTDPRKVQALDEIVEKDQGEYLEFENLKFVN